MDPYGQFDKYVMNAARDVEPAAALVAKSFYKVLRKNGFGNDQIICVATNLLGSLIQTLKDYRVKSEMNDTEGRDDPRKVRRERYPMLEGQKNSRTL